MTLFISEKNKNTVLKKLILYIGITAFIALFGFVYEQFSHGVNSNHMWFAWVRPLLAGVAVYILLYFLPLKKVPDMLTECIYNFGVAMFTTHSIMLGVLEIYGKTNSKMVLAYIILFHIFMLGGIALYVVGLILDKKKVTNEQIK